ncbi:hypothetical protein IP92_05742 [Pseudoduganella flava]|uniref:Uncharacterized protein n=1 Tax=Pseudoduganella flava TaxID=871742 RepID=A0A562P9A1_9BURK|nr:hypothetical protein [Pseudoduganella flava]QGZ42725.1 hypothetical protein GO485_29280 [Pseudoduganella flava]TWI41022.1 hypothetical protein IP92_05742 [Pseudoduganella flava]
MHTTNDRQNTHMRDTIDTIIRQLDDVGRHYAANEMLAWGVPLPVIARVLYEPDRRRQVSPS